MYYIIKSEPVLQLFFIILSIKRNGRELEKAPERLLSQVLPLIPV